MGLVLIPKGDDSFKTRRGALSVPGMGRFTPVVEESTLMYSGFLGVVSMVMTWGRSKLNTASGAAEMMFWLSDESADAVPGNNAVEAASVSVTAKIRFRQIELVVAGVALTCINKQGGFSRPSPIRLVLPKLSQGVMHVNIVDTWERKQIGTVSPLKVSQHMLYFSCIVNVVNVIDRRCHASPN